MDSDGVSDRESEPKRPSETKTGCGPNTGSDARQKQQKSKESERRREKKLLHVLFTDVED